MNFIIYIIFLSWPIFTALMGISFFYTLLPGLIVTVISIIIEVTRLDDVNLKRTIGGWVVLYVIFAVIYVSFGGTISGGPDPILMEGNF